MKIEDWHKNICLLFLSTLHLVLPCYRYELNLICILYYYFQTIERGSQNTFNVKSSRNQSKYGVRWSRWQSHWKVLRYHFVLITNKHCMSLYDWLLSWFDCSLIKHIWWCEWLWQQGCTCCLNVISFIRLIVNRTVIHSQICGDIWHDVEIIDWSIVWLNDINETNIMDVEK